MPRHHNPADSDHGSWSEWTWDHASGQYYRARVNSTTGGWDYEFNQGSTIEPEPEAPDDIATLADTFPSLRLREEDDDKGKLPEDAGEESDTPTETGPHEDEEDDSELQRMISESRRFVREGESSGTGIYGEESPYAQAGEDLSGAPPADEDAVLEASIGIVKEPLDPRFKVERSSRWKPGTVFKIYWSEPMGTNGSTSQNAPSVSNKQVYEGDFGSFYTGFRRFIIVATDDGHSTCVPIATYGGKGCKKHGIKPNKHGIIHAYGSKGRPLSGEPRLGFPPVRIKFTADGEKLAQTSRVNYSKLISIEHNCKVFMIGYISSKDFDTVGDAVDACWGVKDRVPRYKD